MRKIQLALRLHFEAGLSLRAIARTLNASPSTVGEYLRRARLAGLSWPLPPGVDESALETRLFPPSAPAQGPRPLPDWTTVHRELKRKGGDACAAVPGVQERVARGRAVLSVLRALPGLVEAARRRHAPIPPRRREALSRK